MSKSDQRHLFIVEDDVDVQEYLGSCIKDMGYKVTIFSNALSVIKKLNEPGFVMPQAILSDITMPDMTGLELLKVLRGRGFLVPFVIVTGFINEANLTHAVRLGASDFLDKTGSILEIQAVIGRALEIGTKQDQRRAILDQLKKDVPQSINYVEKYEHLLRQEVLMLALNDHKQTK